LGKSYGMMPGMKTTIKPLEEKASVMTSMMEKHSDLFHVPVVGEILTGTIMDKTSNAMYIDLGNWGVGVIYGRELFDDLDTFRSAKLGDTVQATIQQLDNEDGYIELSLRSATRERSWEELRRKLTDATVFESEVIDANKGGLMVRVNGVTGFLPVSQLAPDHYPRVEGGDKMKILDRLKSYTGQKFKIKVINVSQEDEKLIVSEKAAVSEEIGATLEKLGAGKVIEGTVSGVVDFGVFVKFEEAGQELEGLVHISELAWQRIDNPSDFVAIGEKIKAKVIGVDDGLRISLSIKQLQDDPWMSVASKYKVGEMVKGEVLKVTPFGGFVRLDQDIHGLIHISEMPEKAKADPSTLLKAGEMMEFRIISIEPKEHRLGLSLKDESEEKKDEAKEEAPKTPRRSKTSSAGQEKVKKVKEEGETKEEVDEKKAKKKVVKKTAKKTEKKKTA
jgi:small subunit ribosomal protein S1